METEQGIVDDHPEDAEVTDDQPEETPAPDEEGTGEDVDNDVVEEEEPS